MTKLSFEEWKNSNEMKATWAPDEMLEVEAKKHNKSVEEILMNPVDELILQAQSAINAYQDSSNQYTAATNTLTKAQKDYTAAVKSGNEAAILSAESTMKKAEDLVTSLAGGMREALAEIRQLQKDMIRAIADSYKEISKLEAERTKV